MSKEELIRELQLHEAATARLAASAGGTDREALLHNLQVHQVELEMQNRELREAQERLEMVSARYADLYDCAPVGYVTLDLKGHIREINQAGVALLDMPRAKIVDRLFSVVAPLADKLSFLSHLQRCAATQSQVTSELVLLRGKQEQRVVQMISDPVRAPSGETTAYRTILIDISAPKQLEDKLRLLAEAGEKLAASLDYTATLQTVARLTVPALADLCMIDMLGEAGQVDRLWVTLADPRKHKSLAEGLMRLAPRPGFQTPQAQVIASGEPMLLEEVPAELLEGMARDDRRAGLLRAVDLKSILVVPLFTRGRILGALTLAAAESGRRYSALDLRLAQALASRAAMAVDNARLYAEQEMLRKRFERLDQVSSLLNQKLAHSGGSLPTEWLQDLVEQARLACDAEYAALGIGEDPARPFDRWIHSGLDSGLASTIGQHPTPAGLLGEVIRTGRSLRLRDLHAHPAFRGLPLHHPEMRSFLGVVVPDGGRPVGHLYLTNKRSADAFSQDDQDTAEMMAQRAGVALEVARLNRELRVAVSARDTLLAVVSHDLRSPLGLIQLSAEAALGRNSAVSGKTSRLLTSVLHSCQEMSRLIADLLDAASLETGTFTVELGSAAVAPLCAQALATLEPIAARKTIQLEQEVPEGLPPVHGDPGRLGQVLANLIGNAIKFAPARSTIRICARAQERDICFAVSDQGPGIPAEQLPRLFERHWKGKERGREGFGLGLYIAQGIVAAHGGRIWVDSQVGVGTTLSFTIPIAQPSP